MSQICCRKIRRAARTWCSGCCRLHTIEVPIQRLAEIDLFYGEERWARERRPAAVQAVQQRLAELASRLDDRDYLVERFSAADVLMTSVLRFLRHTNLLEGEPALVAYEQRCEARPAFARALAGQMASFENGDERPSTNAS
jgi:glutathione S-transferase